MKMVKTLPEFKYFSVFLKNRNFFSKMRISKVTDYAGLALFKGNQYEHIVPIELQINFIQEGGKP